jgi:hypothetical protein
MLNGSKMFLSASRSWKSGRTMSITFDELTRVVTSLQPLTQPVSGVIPCTVATKMWDN